MKVLKILLVDEHTVVREGLRLLLLASLQCIIVGAVGSFADATSLAREGQAEVIVFEPLRSDERELDLLVSFRAIVPRSRVLILTASHDPRLHHRCITAGAKGIVLKTDDSQVLLRAIERVAAGEGWLSPSLMLEALSSSGLYIPANEEQQRQEQEKLATLTEREKEMVRLMCAGLKNHDIAGQLFISEKTVRNCLTVIFGKLGVRNRLELVFYSFRQGLSQTDES